MKKRLKTKLDSDEHCVEQLQKLQEKGFSYDQLWDDKLCSIVSNIFYIILSVDIQIHAILL